ncbi:MAG: L-glutamate gamma-semialdehyde dehydrogenase [Gemmatimonadetes bacterium]|nr:L-glutamate gamma-semialdehyde dehydrogenase [Gemmatimonadota bacterium]NIR81116.1 L-glutamate gamma-semialdehyde dehydrogenase [Gemmatimonadota bacterium]NIT89940.1 L-glutamate gamma-semialdehyde dehydrogenase [Gemmatimonadota bacterium]NIU33736.1 L-glutamate gamma-semialdehyde dehydrogenase [Gemmatimonadota bacterium]NIU37972.1 L-glutamate gamma-semialdehyde dehydrogenase [Gemmatimonadota bacterium]
MTSIDGKIEVPRPDNDPVRPYAPGDPEREALKETLDRMADQEVEIPLVIGGEEVTTGDVTEAVMPHDHGHVLARWHRAGPDEVERAVAAVRTAWKEWSSWPWRERIDVFLRAAELLAGPWRDRVNAATMLGQSKTAHQAEIDAACELIDFFRFNAHYAQQIYEEQPRSSAGVWNRMEYRPLEGFVYAVTPFNFTSIGGNLPTAPAIMGNVVLWKPSRTAVYSNYQVMRVLVEAGLPAGVVNFVPGDAETVTERVLAQPEFAGIHYTGSTTVFRSLWKEIGQRIADYRSYPRLVGETGGKDFVLAHASADPDALVTALVRGAFEYQGQKCSAVSRAYVPESLWDEIAEPLIETTGDLSMGDPRDFRNFVTAVIDASAFEKITGYIERARSSADAEILVGGEADDSKGWFVQPTIIRAKTPRYESMCEEIFGPVLTVYVYPDDGWQETLQTVDATSPYALTAAVFAREGRALQDATAALKHAAGNFYVNDKPTGAVVGQQPFGGSRASGTNDKAGSVLNLLRWVSARSVKENLNPPTDYRYPFMDGR